MVPEKLIQNDRPPQGHWIARGVRALFVEQRLPYTIQTRLDHALAAIGRRRKITRVGPWRVTFRRCTVDAVFIHSVLINQEYFRPGYAPEPGNTVIDIGGNIGTFTLAAKMLAPTARVIVIEPFPDNLHFLRKNIEGNRLQNVSVVPAAIGSASGAGRLYIAEDGGFHSLVFNRGRGFIDVKVVTMAEIFERFGLEMCDLLKIDCEGAEFEFLPRLEPEIWRRIRRIAMEYSAPVAEWNFGSPTAAQIKAKLEFGDQLIVLLQERGFRIDYYVDCVGFRAGYIFATQEK